MRRFFSFLLIYGVVVAQSLAPVSASLAAARALDPTNSPILCSQQAGATNPSPDSQGEGDHHCPHCLVTLASVALPPPEGEGSYARLLILSDTTWSIDRGSSRGDSVVGYFQAHAPPLTMV
jgi:hypothetical protein